MRRVFIFYLDCQFIRVNEANMLFLRLTLAQISIKNLRV